MFDATSFVAFGVPLLALVFGLTEFFKSMLGWEGKQVTLLAVGLGILVFVPPELIDLIAEPYEQVLRIVYTGITFALSAAGFYKYGAERIPKRTG
jgi:hypothetical protein